MLDIERLKPIHVTDLIRVGRDNDGGYVIPKSILLKSESLLSYGCLLYTSDAADE